MLFRTDSFFSRRETRSVEVENLIFAQYFVSLKNHTQLRKRTTYPKCVESYKTNYKTNVVHIARNFVRNNCIMPFEKVHYPALSNEAIFQGLRHSLVVMLFPGSPAQYVVAIEPTLSCSTNPVTLHRSKVSAPECFFTSRKGSVSRAYHPKIVVWLTLFDVWNWSSHPTF